MGPQIKVPSRVRSVTARFRYLFLLAVVCGGSFFILTISNTTTVFFLNDPSPTSHMDIHRRTTYDDDEQIFTIKTPGCTMPNLKPFDETIQRFIRTPSKPFCRHENISLLHNNETHIWVITDNLQYYHIPGNDSVTCCYKSFYRPEAISDITSKSVDDRAKYGKCVMFSNNIKVSDEFVKITCACGSKVIYEQFFLFAIKKAPITYDEDSYHAEPNQSNYNVIIMGIDAISRMNFYRTMPKTLSFLKKKGAIELFGYNKVGDNTFPNLTPMLMGVEEGHLKRTCWPHLRSNFDNCPFIWEWFKDAGYYTALGEDSARLGTFNYEKFGFVRSPTDYYIHTFMHEAEINVGNNKDYNTFVCMGNKFFYQVLLDYIASLTKTLKSSKLFGFFWEVTLSHDFLNYPMLMDDSYESVLKKLDESKYLDKTVLILLSDHGIRWGGIRLTKQGRLEERLPFVHILLPSSFREKYQRAYTNMRQNSRRLTTPFDMHATLMDLINMEDLGDDKIELRSRTSYAHDRSISLFLPIPNNRTCRTADIDDHWCTCHKFSKLAVDSQEVSEASKHLVHHLNTMIQEYPQCARLSLEEVLEATVMTQEAEEEWREIMVMVKTLPGGGVFEATLRNDSNKWTLAGSVSRLNLYGEQSHCVHHYHMKLYCFCD